MNDTTELNNLQNPWADRSTLPAVELRNCLFAAVACLICALALPFSLNATVAPLLAALLFACVVFFARTRAPVTLTLIPALLISLLLGISGAVMFLAALVGTAVTAYLITVLKRGCLTTAIPLVAFAVALAVTRDWRVSLLALAFLPAAILLAVATLLGKKRTTAICFAIGGFLISLLTIILIALYLTQGKIDRAAVTASVDSLRELFIGEMQKMRDLLMQETSKAVVDAQTQATYDQLMQDFSGDEVYKLSVQLFDTVLGIIPALAAILCAVLAFEAQSLLNTIYGNFGFSEVLTIEATEFTMSGVSAVLYAASFFLTLFVSESAMVGAVLQNVALILLPGFCVIGVQDIARLLSRMRGNSKFFFVLMVGAMLCFGAGGGLLYALAMWGAYGALMRRIRARMLDAMQNSSGQDRED